MRRYPTATNMTKNAPSSGTNRSSVFAIGPPSMIISGKSALQYPCSWDTVFRA